MGYLWFGMKRSTSATVFSGLVMAAACTTVAVATAGYRYSGANVSVTTTWGTGAAGAARNSSLANEYIYCSISASTSSLAANCWAQNSAGTLVQCSTTNPNLIEVVKKMSSDSYIQFNFTPSTKQCTSIQVFSGSDYAPKI